jgi:iron complex outermembrane receptor protein
MKPTRVVVSTLLMALALLVPGAGAQDDKGYQEYSLGEIVVSGRSSAVREIAVANEIRTEDFEAVNAESVADALTHVPGVQVTYGRKYFPSVNIRGFDQNRILTLIDGVPYYETKYGGMDLNQIGLESVARIDVVKGAPSVLYGPNALGGVVNIITKEPTEKPHLSATVEYGLDGLDDAYKASISHGRKVGNFNYWLSYSHRQWDSWDLSDDFAPRIGQIRRRPGGTTSTRIEDGGERENSDYRTDNFWGKMGLEPSADTEVYVNFHYISSEKGDAPNLDRVNVFPDFTQFDRITDYDDWGVDLSAKHAFSERFDLQAKLYYHDHSDDYTSYADQTYSRVVAVSTYKDDILGGMLLGDFRPVDWDALRFSLHYKKDTHEQRDLETLPFAESYAYTGSMGLENEMTLLDDRLSVVAGVSYDWFDVRKADEDVNNDGNIVDSGTPGTRDELNPMIGMTYEVVDRVKLFASVAKKTRFPTLSQLYSGNIPNLDLSAETAINYTAGLSWRYRDLMSVELAPFFHDISDFITREVPPEENPYSQYKNHDEVEMQGVEVNAVITPMEDLSFKLGCMYNDADNKSPGRVSDEVLGVPQYTFNFGVQYTLPVIGTRLNGNMLYLGKSYRQLPTPADPKLEVIENESYQLCNIKITQPLLSDRMEAFLAVDNLFDENYEPNSGYPAPGMSMWLGLSFRM